MNIFKVLSNPYYLNNLVKIKLDIFPPKKLTFSFMIMKLLEAGIQILCSKTKKRIFF